MVSRWLVALVVPVLIVVFLWFTRSPPFESQSASPVSTIQPAVVQWYHYVGGIVLLVFLLWMGGRGGGVFGYREEDIKRMLRAWLRENEGMTLGDVWACVRDPETKAGLTRIVFRVTQPEEYSDCFCYVSFQRGRFEGLQKYLTKGDCDRLLERRLLVPPKLLVKPSGWGKLLGGSTSKEEKK